MEKRGARGDLREEKTSWKSLHTLTQMSQRWLVLTTWCRGESVESGGLERSSSRVVD